MEYKNRHRKLNDDSNPIDWEQIGIFASLLATEKEIAAMARVSVSTLERRCLEENGKSWDEFLEEHRAIGKMSIRRAQFKLAVEQMNTSMLIHLGKSELGQDITSGKTIQNENKENLSILKLQAALEQMQIPKLLNDPDLIKQRYLIAKSEAEEKKEQ